MLKIVLLTKEWISVEADNVTDLDHISHNLGTPAGENPYNIHFNRYNQKWYMDIPKDDLEIILFRFSCIH